MSPPRSQPPLGRGLRAPIATPRSGTAQRICASGLKRACVAFKQTASTCSSSTPGRAPGIAIHRRWKRCVGFQKEGKIRAIGISTPEHDQNALVDLMRGGWLDSIQVIYNIFDQEAQAELLPAALENNVGVIVRVVLDEGSLAGKWTTETKFAEGDFRNRYFAGDRLRWAVRRVAQVRETIGDQEPNMVTAAIKFGLKPAAVSTVLVGIRNVEQAEMNCGVSDQPAHDRRPGERAAQAQLAQSVLV